MEKLGVENYKNCFNLFKLLNSHLAVEATLKGMTSCDLMVDDISSPSIAIIKSNNRYYIGMRREKNTFLNLLDFFKKMKSSTNKFFQLYFGSEVTEEKFLIIMTGWNHKTLNRVKYKITTPKFRSKIEMPSFVKISTVKEIMTSGIDYVNIDDLKKEMCSERKSVEDFLNKSFGLCLIFENHLIGWCLSEYNTDESCEIGIEINEKFQNKLLGTFLTEQFIIHAKSLGIKEIYWNSLKINMPSIKTAERAGFEKVMEYKEILIY